MTMRVVPWRVSDALLGLVLVFSTTFTILVGLGVLFGVWLKPGHWEQPDFAANITATTTLSWFIPCAMLTTVWVLGIRRYNTSWQTVGLRTPCSLKFLILPWLFVIVSLSFLIVYSVLISRLDMDMLTPRSVPPWVLGEGLYLFINMMSLGIIGPLAEEVFFRGFILQAFIQPVGRIWASVIASLIFSASHLSLGVAIPFFVTGLLLSWLYIRSNSIWPSFTAHAAQNILALLLIAA